MKMKSIVRPWTALLFVLGVSTVSMAGVGDKPTVSIYDFTLNDIDGKPVPLSEFRGKVVLVVNIASKCGYTYQYEGLESMYGKYKERGFVVLGFPSNDFLGQEPGTNEQIKEFCTRSTSISHPGGPAANSRERSPGTSTHF